VPTVAAAVPTLALDAEVIVPTAGPDAPIIVETKKIRDKTTQTHARKRAIGPPTGPKKAYSLARTTSIEILG